MYDKLVYSICWLAILLWAFAEVGYHGLGGIWTWLWWFVIVAILIQLCVVMYHGSDAYTRHRMWKKMKGKP